MTVENNHVIAIATPCDWLENLAPVEANEKLNQNQLHLVCPIFPLLLASCRSLLAILIGSSHYLLLL